MEKEICGVQSSWCRTMWTESCTGLFRQKVISPMDLSFAVFVWGSIWKFQKESVSTGFCPRVGERKEQNSRSEMMDFIMKGCTPSYEIQRLNRWSTCRFLSKHQIPHLQEDLMQRSVR